MPPKQAGIGQRRLLTQGPELTYGRRNQKVERRDTENQEPGNRSEMLDNRIPAL